MEEQKVLNEERGNKVLRVTSNVLRSVIRRYCDRNKGLLGVGLILDFINSEKRILVIDGSKALIDWISKGTKNKISKGVLSKLCSAINDEISNDNNHKIESNQKIQKIQNIIHKGWLE